eukprot:scaffold2468_cov169-Prasinococcus_capsulatus_cf.AAC.1
MSPGWKKCTCARWQPPPQQQQALPVGLDCLRSMLALWCACVRRRYLVAVELEVHAGAGIGHQADAGGRALTRVRHRSCQLSASSRQQAPRPRQRAQGAATPTRTTARQLLRSQPLSSTMNLVFTGRIEGRKSTSRWNCTGVGAAACAGAAIKQPSRTTGRSKIYSLTPQTSQPASRSAGLLRHQDCASRCCACALLYSSRGWPRAAIASGRRCKQPGQLRSGARPASSSPTSSRLAPPRAVAPAQRPHARGQRQRRRTHGRASACARRRARRNLPTSGAAALRAAADVARDLAPPPSPAERLPRGRRP